MAGMGFTWGAQPSAIYSVYRDTLVLSWEEIPGFVIPVMLF